MKKVGNYSNWLKDEWIEEIFSKTGQPRPKPTDAYNEVGRKMYQRYINAGYNPNDVNWYLFDPPDLSFDIDPPWVEHQFHWWVIKMHPGQFMPVHTDPHVHDEKKVYRWWMPLTDFELGHVFVLKDDMLKNYKKGDLFLFDDPYIEHAAANIGLTSRAVLQITEIVLS